MNRLWLWLRWAWHSVPRTPRRGGGLSVWIYLWWTQRFTTHGKVVLVIIASMGLLVGIPGQTMVRLPLALFACAYLLAWIRTWLTAPLEGTWRFPQQIVEGQNFQLMVNVKNKRSRWFHSVGAGLYWEERWIVNGAGEEELIPLGPNAEVWVRVPLRALVRGPCRLRGPILTIHEPLGLMRARVGMDAPTLVLVRPRPLIPQGLEFLTQGAGGERFAMLLSAHGRSRDEVVGVREYQTGDSLRDLHHKAWARIGRPMSREYGQERGQGVVLVVETGCDSFLERSALDPMLRVALGLAQWLAEREVLGRFVLDGREVDLTSGANLTDIIAERLAAVEHPRWGRWPRLKVWAPEARPLGPVLAVGCAQSRSRAGAYDDEALFDKRIFVLPPGIPIAKNTPRDRILMLTAEGECT